MHRIATLIALVSLGLGLLAAPGHLALKAIDRPDFTHFESAHVHPATLTPDGTRLLVVNTPDNRLSVFDVTGAQPWRIAEIPVGLEPVSVAALDDRTAWVVNNLSDDVSVVDLTTLHVKATLRVGDEPNDVVFAGNPKRAYVTVSQEDRVRVYDPADLAAPPVDVPIDGRYPRALATNAAGTSVYAAVFFAGNRTSVLSFQEVPADSQPQDPQFPRDPQLTAAHGPAPRVGLIVQQQGNDWRDMYGKLWNSKLPYRMHDVDVAEIPAGAARPSRTFGDLASINFAIAVSPTDGRLAVAGTEALNLLRFEPRLKGHMVDTRVNFVTTAGATRPVDLNPHVDYSGPGTRAERDSALGIPTGIAWSGNGQRAYVTSLASDKLGVLDAAGGAVVARVGTVAGPTGVVVDDARGRIYVVGRFRNELQTLSAANLREVARTGIGFDPTPDEIVNGRKFFYGGFTSAHGDQSCASCHVFGDFDNLAWDLGNPAGHFDPPVTTMNDPLLKGFDPMKGPMTTQSLRALPGTGRLHWRGDRLDLNAFNPAFVELMGLQAQLPDSQMTAFNHFVNRLVYPPNPYQHLDRSMPDAPRGSPSARRGRTIFFDRPIDEDRTCSFCHKAPVGTDGQILNGPRVRGTQDMKTPQLRNLYKKTGFTDAAGVVSKRGFGFGHDGAFDSIFRFLKQNQFEFDPGPDGDLDRRDVEAFLLAFDTGTAPAVGCQITFDAGNRANPALLGRVDTLRAQSQTGACDLVARGRVGGQPRGWWYQTDGTWRSDKAAEPALSTAGLLALAGPGTELSIVGVPPGSGARMGNDRDRDGHLDGDELDAGSDPGDGRSMPMGPNRRPTVSAGADLAVTLPASAPLAGSVADDGLPAPGALGVRWTKAAGPGVVAFANPLAATTTASFTVPGTYDLLLTATDGALTTSDAVRVTVAPAPCNGALERRIAAGADDAEEGASGGVSLTSSDLELVEDGSLQTVGLRFTGVAIPQGAIVTRAWVQFRAHAAHSGATTLRLQGEDADSAAAFTSATRNVSARARTDAAVTWTPGAWTSGVAGAAQRTPDLAAVLQEIVDRPGWRGRSLALVVTGTGRRAASSFEGLASGAALLHVEWDCPGANRAPAVDAGADRTIQFEPMLRSGGAPLERRGGAGATLEHDIPSTLLAGRVTDDGLPDPPARVTTRWRQISGPGGVAFTDSTALAPIVTFAGAGVYELSLTASDGELTGTDRVTITVVARASVVERAIPTGADDVEETASGSVSLTSSDLDLMLDGSSAHRAVGLRFLQVSVPPRARITAAWVQFRARESRMDPTTLTVRAHAHDNAPAFTTASGGVTARPLTAAAATGTSLPAWVSGQATAAERTPDFTDVVQEIVNRPGWMGGNALALVITGTGRRAAYSFEGGAANAPVLHVEYTTGTGHTPVPGGPTVYAGADTTVALTGAAWLRGHPIGTVSPATILMWRRISGPGSVAFDTPGAWTTRATFAAPGVYGIELMAMDGMLHMVDTVAVTVTDPRPAVVETRVAAGADDVEESAGGGVSLSSSDLEMMLDGSSAQRAVGVRFASVAIPPGARIATAWVQFKAKESHSEGTTLTVRAHAHDHAPAFASASGNVTARPLTSAAAAWTNVPGWVAGQALAAQRTPELASVLQEIVDRPGWTSGNALALVVTGSGRRVAYSFESGAANAPVLHVEYATAPPSPPPVVNQPPTVDAGPDTTVALGGAAFLRGQASDDGRPGPMMAHWIVRSGPGSVSFDDVMSPVTRATFGALGRYRLELMAMDGALDVSDSVTITVVASTSANTAPVAALTVSPAIGIAPLAVTFDASASTDADGDPLTYSFDFGDAPAPSMACGVDGDCCCAPAPCACHGTRGVGLDAAAAVSAATTAAAAGHVYEPGTWTVTLVVRDNRGGADTTTATIQSLENLVRNPSFETSLTGWNANGTRATVARVAGGRDGGYCLEARGDSLPANTFGANDAPNWVSPHGGPGARYRFTAWVRSASHAGRAQIRVREYLNGVLQGTQHVSPLVTLTSEWQLLTLEVTATVAGGTLDFQVMNKPVVGREVFQVDDVAVVLLPATAAFAAGATAAEAEAPLPAPVAPPATRLSSVFPNPSAGAATLRFELAREADVEIEVYDLRGALVRRIAGGWRRPGAYTETWDGRDRDGRRLPRGVYLVRFDAGHHRESRKITISR